MYYTELIGPCVIMICLCILFDIIRHGLNRLIHLAERQNEQLDNDD
jgi:hypothetical protein